MFTTAAVATLVDRKQLSFDTRLGAILPDYPSADARERVTVRDLLTMSSGRKYFASSPLQFAPGTTWEYQQRRHANDGEAPRRRCEGQGNGEAGRSCRITIPLDDALRGVR